MIDAVAEDTIEDGDSTVMPEAQENVSSELIKNSEMEIAGSWTQGLITMKPSEVHPVALIKQHESNIHAHTHVCLATLHTHTPWSMHSHHNMHAAHHYHMPVMRLWFPSQALD